MPGMIKTLAMPLALLLAAPSCGEDQSDKPKTPAGENAATPAQAGAALTLTYFNVEG